MLQQLRHEAPIVLLASIFGLHVGHVGGRHERIAYCTGAEPRCLVCPETGGTDCDFSRSLNMHNISYVQEIQTNGWHSIAMDIAEII